MAEQRVGSGGGGGGRKLEVEEEEGRGVGYFLIVQRFPNLIAFHNGEPLAKI